MDLRLLLIVLMRLRFWREDRINQKAIGDLIGEVDNYVFLGLSRKMNI